MTAAKYRKYSVFLMLHKRVNTFPNPKKEKNKRNTTPPPFQHARVNRCHQINPVAGVPSKIIGESSKHDGHKWGHGAGSCLVIITVIRYLASGTWPSDGSKPPSTPSPIPGPAAATNPKTINPRSLFVEYRVRRVEKGTFAAAGFPLASAGASGSMVTLVSGEGEGRKRIRGKAGRPTGFRGAARVMESVAQSAPHLAFRPSSVRVPPGSTGPEGRAKLRGTLEHP
ncbi:hypothetical protein BDK51DRAFT_28818 [Blyttiomyces helicus]|uniref:Uncharacterized protein n=1 Tax=Blyttiomyces helicus TaxID=388810 RepID=A0A4P9WQH6_9FUNG|nr:hypothetical protein BDK51DRAFT_28818 [Blyttiomyces helicus]|eukprot:RKO94068.1 hypothetical protein BDK51DRAFT_28818 [Blyttiomyces helicus]